MTGHGKQDSLRGVLLLALKVLTCPNASFTDLAEIVSRIEPAKVAMVDGEWTPRKGTYIAGCWEPRPFHTLTGTRDPGPGWLWAGPVP